MENSVVTLDTARKLSDAGWGQPTAMIWADGKLINAKRYRQGMDAYDAPTAQEIADQLPKAGEIRLKRLSAAHGYRWSAARFHEGDTDPIAAGVGDTIAEALAALYLALQEAK